MSEHLAWVLDRARAHTLALVADVPAAAMQLQAAPGDRHPAWLLGHLLLADTYLLSLLGVQPLGDEFPLLLERYGPASAPTAQDHYDPRHQLIDRLSRVNAARVARVSAMADRDLVVPLPDTLLAQAQPTIGHHLQSLVFHEGYHSGQLSSWRRTHGFTAVWWTLGPAPRGAGRLMTQVELTDFANQYAAAWSSRNPAGLAAFYTDDGALTVNAGAPSVGRAAITAAAGGFMTAFPDMVVKLRKVSWDGRHAIFRWVWTGTNSGPGGTGKQVRIEGHEEWTLGANGLIAESRGHYDEAEYARQLQVGVPPAP